MITIECDEVRKYLDRARGYKQGLTLYDCHVHPLEVLFGGCREADPHGGECIGPRAGVTAPEIGPLTESGDEPRDEAACRFRRAAQVVALKRTYRHASPEVLRSHMAMAAVDVSLLLPVAAASGGTENAMAVLGGLYGGDEGFLIGCSIPNGVGIDDMDRFLSRMKTEYRVRAVKLHPNITQVDLSAPWGKERAEAILTACGRSRLALVVHGGRSTVLKNAEAHAYGSIGNMEFIDWSLGGHAVVIAHAGAYECTPLEVEREVLPVLARLLSRHPKLFLDLSGLGCEAQTRILRKAGPERIVFGSDALYGTPWREAVKLLYSLERAGCDPERGYRMIGGETPRKYLFEEREDHVCGLDDTAAANR